jgi:hypothetical protein
MGIPRFFAWVKKNYPNLINVTLKASLPENSYVEGLYFDLNSPIHEITQRLFKYGLDRDWTQDDSDLQEMYRQMTTDERKNILFGNIGLYLFYCYMLVKPKRILMIAVDGVAPKAKMCQQRLRRFRPSGAPLDFFDAVVISPGTKFMDELDKYLSETWPALYRSSFDEGLNIIYSSHREPGEGEHKIFNQMNLDLQGGQRVRTTNEFRGYGLTPYQVVLGADSDLIVLSLSRTNNIIFMRTAMADYVDMSKVGAVRNPDLLEDSLDSVVKPKCSHSPNGSTSNMMNVWMQFLKTVFVTTNLNQLLATPQNLTPEITTILTDLRNSWIRLFEMGFNYTNITSMRERLSTEFIAPNDIFDFAFISFFVGNDFLPAIPELETVTAMSPIYYSDGDIILRYRDVTQQLIVLARQEEEALTKAGNSQVQQISRIGGKDNRRKGGSEKKIERERIDIRKGFERTGKGLNIPPFNDDDFWQLFKDKERTWIYRDGSHRIDYDRAAGIENKVLDRMEIFPLVLEPLTGLLRRVMYTKKKGTNDKWQLQREDNGSLMRCLTIYRTLMATKGMSLKGHSNSFIVENKNRINYPNLFEYLRELYEYSMLLMESTAANYQELEKRQAENPKLEPDPLIRLSVGIRQIGKKNKKPSFVPAGFSAMHKAIAFGIYDSQYADPQLPKQAIDEMCRKWLEGAQWTLKYYSDGPGSINTRWFYPFDSAPSLPDLMHYIEERLIVNIQGYPGIGVSRLSPTVSVERINLEGSVTVQMVPDPADPDNLIARPIVNRSTTAIINVYKDATFKTVALMKLPTGEEKFVDMNKLQLLKPVRRLITGTSGYTEPSIELGTVDLSKKTFIEVGRQTISLPVTRSFPLDEVILGVVTNIAEPYASVVESFFSIMPERVLKLLLSPYLVDHVVKQISDAFPKAFEMVVEGKFYEGQSVPKIPFLSPLRLQRAMDSIPEEFDVEIGRYNVRKRRQQIFHRGATIEIKDIVPGAARLGRITQGYGALNVAIHTTKKQQSQLTTDDIGRNEGRLVTEISKYVTGGVGDLLGGVLPQYNAYAMTLTRPLMNSELTVGLLTSTEEAEIAKYATFAFQIPDSYILPTEDAFPIRFNILPTHLKYVDSKKIKWGSTDFEYDGQRKLLLNEVLFLTKYGHLSDTVLYIGSAPGHHIPIVATMFPKHKFELWDPAPFAIREQYLQNSNIELFKQPFTEKTALLYRGRNVLLISDLRILTKGHVQPNNKGPNTQTDQTNDELKVMNDNYKQLQFVNLINPRMSMLKFRLPFIYDPPERIYAEGEIWLQAWSKPRSAEVRLILDGINVVQIPIERARETVGVDPGLFPAGSVLKTQKIKMYNIKDFEDKMHYYNLVIRQHAVVKNPLGLLPGRVKGLRDNFESAYEVYIWNQWLLMRYGLEIPVEQRQQGVILLINAVSGFLGKDLNHKIVTKVPYNQRTFTMPF